MLILPTEKRHTYMKPLFYERVPVDVAAFTCCQRNFSLYAMCGKERAYLHFFG